MERYRQILTVTNVGPVTRALKSISSSSVTMSPTKALAVIEAMNCHALIQDFVRVASIAGKSIAESDIDVESLPAPHRATSLPKGKMAVYVFSYGDVVLKVGKVGANSGPRYTHQHYNAASAASTLAASLINGGADIGASGLTVETAGEWIRTNTHRTNFLLKAEQGVPLLSLLEAFLHCRLEPRFEGFASQR